MNLIVWHGEAGDLIVPDFNGLKPALVNGRAIYRDAKGAAGEFKPNLTIDGKQTGVVVARGDLVAAMTKSVHDAGGYQLGLPFDARDIPNNAGVTVEFKIVTFKNGSSFPGAVIEIPKGYTARVVQFEYDKPHAVLLPSPDQGGNVNWAFFNETSADIPQATVTKGYELDSTIIYGTSDGHLEPNPNTPTQVGESPMGQDFGSASGEMSIGCYSPDGSATYALSDANILTVGGKASRTPVAIMANDRTGSVP